MVQTADLGRLDHLTGVGGRDGAGVGRIFHEGQMGPRAVVVNEVGREDSVQMSLAEDDYMVEKFAADRSDQALDEGVLPRGTGCAHDLGDAHAFEAMAKGRAVNAVAIPHQVLGGGVVGKCLDDLLCGPSGRGVLGDVEVQYASAVVDEDKEDKEDAEGGGRDGEEVDRGEGPQMIVEEGAPGLGGSFRGSRGIKRETVRSPMSMPSLRSSPWMRGAPQVELAVAMRRTRSRTSWPVGVRPGERRDFQVQKRRKAVRCQRTTVAGRTIARASRQRDHAHDSAIQKRRSVQSRVGRGRRRLRTASC